MSIAIGETLGDSFAYAKEGLVGQWVRWILLIIISWIPIIDFIFIGYLLRIMKGATPAPELEDYGDLFIKGLIAFIITIIWFLPVWVIGLLLSVGILFDGIASGALFDPLAFIGTLVAVGIGSLAIISILSIILSFLWIIGLIRFARTKRIGEAFALRKILDIIAQIGGVNYLIAILAFCVMFWIVQLVFGLIPILGWVLMIVAYPLLFIWGARYVTIIYDSADVAT